MASGETTMTRGEMMKDNGLFAKNKKKWVSIRETAALP